MPINPSVVKKELLEIRGKIISSYVDRVITKISKSFSLKELSIYFEFLHLFQLLYSESILLILSLPPAVASLVQLGFFVHY